LTDRSLAGGRGIEALVDSLLAGGARLIQIREKFNSPGALDPVEFRETVRRCATRVRAAGGVLILNDDPDLAVATGADGVHVGQDDCPPRRAREIVGSARLLGLSTHTREQVLAALEEPVDYVAIGPVFGTTSKQSPYAALGLEFAAWAWSEAHRRGMPMVAIGGISPANVGGLLAVAPGIRPAVIGALMTEGDIAARTIEFLAAMRRGSR
jgi:thiamine-phosphate pyrophosphorylase